MQRFILSTQCKTPSSLLPHTVHASLPPSLCLLYLCCACLSNMSFQGDTLHLPQHRTCFAVHHVGIVPSFPERAAQNDVQSQSKYFLLPPGKPSVTVMNALLL